MRIWRIFLLLLFIVGLGGGIFVGIVVKRYQVLSDQRCIATSMDAMEITDRVRQTMKQSDPYLQIKITDIELRALISSYGVARGVTICSAMVGDHISFLFGTNAVVWFTAEIYTQKEQPYLVVTNLRYADLFPVLRVQEQANTVLRDTFTEFFLQGGTSARRIPDKIEIRQGILYLYSTYSLQ